MSLEAGTNAIECSSPNYTSVIINFLNCSLLFCVVSYIFFPVDDFELLNMSAQGTIRDKPLQNSSASSRSKANCTCGA